MQGYIPPQPNPAVELRVRSQLQSIDPLLDIKWQRSWVFNAVDEQLEGRYVLICYWPQADRRWSEVQEQRSDAEPFDILGVFAANPTDFESIPESPEAVMELVLQLLASCDAERVPHAARMAEVHDRNAQRRVTNRTDMVDEMVEEALKARSGVYKPPFVTVGTDLRS